MKKILILLLILFSLNESLAQFNLGLKAGGNLSIIQRNVEDNREVKEPKLEGSSISDYSYQFGFTSYYEISKEINLTTELMYTRKGVNPLMLHYLTLPTVLGYRLGDFNFELGMDYGFLLSARINSTGNKITNGYPRFDFSVVTGASYFLTNHIKLNINWIMGVIPIEDFNLQDLTYSSGTDPSANGDDVQIKDFNRSLQLSVVYLF